MDSLSIISHTDYSRSLQPGGLGEVVLAEKIKYLLGLSYSVQPVIDVYQLFESQGCLQEFLQYCQINYQLAENDHDLIDECSLLKQARLESREPMLWLTWGLNIAGLIATGWHKSIATIAKLYVFHPNEIVLPKLYQPVEWIVTESLLANIRGAHYGIPQEKMIYLPHHYSDFVQDLWNLDNQQKVKIKEQYLSELALSNNKCVDYDRDVLIVGCVSRLQYRKNIEYALFALRKFKAQHPTKPFYFILKGDFDSSGEWRSDYSYHDWLKNVIAEFQNEPWFLWDRTYTAYPKCLRQFISFDIALHLSGAEGASNVVVDFLSLAIPTLLLKASTNPYLFASAAAFVKAGPIRPGPLPFNTPDEEDLYLQLEHLLTNGLWRKKLGQAGLKYAQQCFSPQIARERLAFIMDAVHNVDKKKIRKKCLTLFRDDIKRHQISHG